MLHMNHKRTIAETRLSVHFCYRQYQ